MTRPSPSTVTDEGLVETVARAIYRSSGQTTNDGRNPWTELDDLSKLTFEHHAKAALAASGHTALLREIEVLADKAAAAMQQARDEIGATVEQRIAFAYAEAAMRAALSRPE